MKRKANISIELQGLKCDHWVWPWSWPWPWIFKVKYGISYISAKSGTIATKQKANISNSRPQIWPMGLTLTLTLTFEFWTSNVTLTFDHTHDLDHGFSWSNFEIAVSQTGRADWHCTKGGGRRSFMAMTIWWPRSGVWIYQIVTGWLQLSACRRLI